MTFANYETDKVDSYMEITFPDYDNPVVILYDETANPQGCIRVLQKMSLVLRI